MKHERSVRKLRAMSLMVLSGGLGLPAAVLAEDQGPAVQLADASGTDVADATDAGTGSKTVEVKKVEVKAKRVNKEVNILNNEPVDSVFGFDKSIKDTPRSVTSISNETLNKLNITDINDLVALSPGSFTQSFFGVAGSLDLRGTPGETYFRGVRRIDNPGNYPTVIGASDRIDIVRGPASPMYGPSKIGGYLNFVPKSARAEDGALSPTTKGEVGETRGSWEKNIVHGEVGGPGKVFGKDFGYYLYVESENSSSYYQNTSTRDNVFQASFDSYVSESTRIEFGGMYQDYRGNQVAGWNRLTQDLVNNGTYITGSPANIDTNGDGLISAAEAGAANLAIFYPFGSSDPNVKFGSVNVQTASTVNADLAAHPNMALQNPGTAHLKGYQVLVAPGDKLESQISTAYFDLTHTFTDAFKVVNKVFYEKLVNINENAYGFSQYADTYAVEDQLNFSYKPDYGQYVSAAYQFGPSIRYQDFKHGDDFAFEYFDRRDLTGPNNAYANRALSTRDGEGVEPYSNNTVGSYTNYGVALLADYSFFKSLHLLAGGRWDWADINSQCITAACAASDTPKETGFENKPSWSASLSYDILDTGLTPYVTRANQSTLIVGQGGQVEPSNVADGTALASSKLTEYGLKGSFWDSRLFASLAHFKQTRTDLNSQDTVTNNTTESRGWEFETRGIVTNNLAVTGAYTHVNVYNLSALQGGTQFGFAGASDLPAGVDPSQMFGGVVNGLIVPSQLNPEGKKAGVPEDMYSINLIYNFDAGWLKGLTTTVGVTHVSSTYSGFSQAVLLPSYTLLNASLNYETKHWKLGLQGKNLTDERYFRSNFPDLFGSSIVLPELPINWLASLAYKF
jgi:iron complex outermembrane receptor protein